LEKVDDQAIKTAGMTRFEDDDSDVAWLEPEMDFSVPSLEQHK